MSNLITRILVALVGIPLIIFLTYQGGILFFIFILLASLLSLNEFYTIVRKKSVFPLQYVGLFFGVLISFVFLYERIKYFITGFFIENNIMIGYPTQFVLLLAVVSIFSFTVLLIELFRNKGSAILNISTTLFGVFYISIFFGMLIATRELFDWDLFYSFLSKNNVSILISNNYSGLNDPKYWGGSYIISIFSTIWICDSAAYFIGMNFGKHKLFERVSPKKSWEGAIAGFIFAIFTMIFAKFLVLPFLSITHAIIIGIIIGSFGQIGDLCQSLLKRDSNVKDSSSLLPGHGGIFDRFDSIIFVSPLIYLYTDLIIFYF